MFLILLMYHVCAGEFRQYEMLVPMPALALLPGGGSPAATAAAPQQRCVWRAVPIAASTESSPDSGGGSWERRKCGRLSLLTCPAALQLPAAGAERCCVEWTQVRCKHYKRLTFHRKKRGQSDHECSVRQLRILKLRDSPPVVAGSRPARASAADDSIGSVRRAGTEGAVVCLGRR